MKLIAAVDSDWAIGYRNNLLYNIPADMQFFKEKTVNNVVIMGRRTFESLPQKKPLRNRLNIVLSSRISYSNENIVVCRSLHELFDYLYKLSTKEIYVIGGENIYSQLLPYCSLAYITKIMKKSTADKFMINLDNNSNWKLISKNEVQYYNSDINFSFLTYKNLNIIDFNFVKSECYG